MKKTEKTIIILAALGIAGIIALAFLTKPTEAKAPTTTTTPTTTTAEPEACPFY
jgi:hypothetical protein